MENRQLKELLLQSLEHERGGVKLYEAAIACVLYALTAWPLQALGWLAAAGVLRFVGRHPVAALFR